MKWPSNLRALSWADWWVALQALAWLSAMRLVLLLVPFRRVRQWSERAARSGGRGQLPDDVTEARVRRLAWATRNVARRLLADKPCLVQALVVQVWAGRMGVPTTLCLGATKGASGELLAHAWIERDGEVLVGGRSSPRRYAPFRPPRSLGVTQHHQDNLTSESRT